VTSNESLTSITSSAFMETHEVERGSVTGYEEASVSKTVRICVQGAAHGAWKEIICKAEDGIEAVCWCHSSSDLISNKVDIAMEIVRKKNNRHNTFNYVDGVDAKCESLLRLALRSYRLI
jgi:hypothetical protein